MYKNFKKFYKFDTIIDDLSLLVNLYAVFGNFPVIISWNVILKGDSFTGTLALKSGSQSESFY